MNLQACAEIMNRLPWVRWDRCVADGTALTVYGWIDRPDSHEDFVLLQFEQQPADGGTPRVGYTTSCAERSEEIGQLIYGAGATKHYPCERVEHVFPAGMVARVVAL